MFNLLFAVWPVPPQSQYYTTEPEADVPTGRCLTSAAPEVSDSPLHILTAAHLSSLRRLLSHEKTTGCIVSSISLNSSLPHQKQLQHCSFHS